MGCRLLMIEINQFSDEDILWTGVLLWWKPPLERYLACFLTLGRKGDSIVRNYENNRDIYPILTLEEFDAHSNEFRIGRRSIMTLSRSCIIIRKSASGCLQLWSGSRENLCHGTTEVNWPSYSMYFISATHSPQTYHNDLSNAPTILLFRRLETGSLDVKFNTGTIFFNFLMEWLSAAKVFYVNPVSCREWTFSAAN